MSSAGIAVLMKCYKQLQRIDGSLVVTRPSPQVRTVLEMTGLAGVLIEAGEPAAGAELDRSTVPAWNGTERFSTSSTWPPPPRCDAASSAPTHR